MADETFCYYIIKRHHPQLDVRALLTSLLPLLTITDVSATIIQQSLNSEFTDFEDGLQYFSAISVSEIEAIVAHNPKDFGPAQVLILEPGMAMAMI